MDITILKIDAKDRVIDMLEVLLWLRLSWLVVDCQDAALP